MANFNRGRQGSDRDFNRRGFRDQGSRGPVEMHKAICNRCGKECEVPFRPTAGKPVYCSNCFESNRGSDRSTNYEDKQSLRSDDLRSMFEAVCDECGNSCKVPFQPRGDKPIYCSNCFGEKKGVGGKETGQSQPHSQSLFKEQFETLNNKLDKILQLLDKKPEEQVVIATEETKVVKKRSPKRSLAK